MKKLIIFILFAAILFTGCADSQPHIQECLTGTTYGFWSGLWHGMIAPIAFIGSLFSDNIAIWAVNNTGGWYAFGFILGIGGMGSGFLRFLTR